MLNDKYFPKDGGLLGNHVAEVEGYKYPHLQLRNVSYSRGGRRLLDSISLEARGGELVAILATNSKNIPTFSHTENGKVSLMAGVESSRPFLPPKVNLLSNFPKENTEKSPECRVQEAHSLFDI